MIVYFRSMIGKVQVAKYRKMIMSLGCFIDVRNYKEEFRLQGWLLIRRSLVIHRIKVGTSYQTYSPNYSNMTIISLPNKKKMPLDSSKNNKAGLSNPLTNPSSIQSYGFRITFCQKSFKKIRITSTFSTNSFTTTVENS